MSETGSGRPLTRRERRLREMQQQAQQTDAHVHEEPAKVADSAEPERAETEAATAGATETDIDVDIDESLIEVPTVDEEGNPLPRRVIRRLREEAIAELREAKLAERAALDAQVIAPETTEPDTDEERVIAFADVPTEALSLEELREIERDSVLNEPDEEPVAAVDETVEAFEEILEESGVAPEIVETETPGQADTDAGSRAAVDEEPLSEAAAAEEATADTVEPEIEAHSAAETGPEEGEAADEEGYSFPDIKPPEFDPPIFDDPSARSVGVPEDAPQGTGFDDMIQRAVADENASVHTGTSSLILPTIPGSDGLSGPIGSTGDLYITGSLELPKSLGETGGHSRLQDSVEGDAQDDQESVDMFNLTDVYETNEFDSAPVSASQAVSARSIEKSGITAPEVQHDNKKSLILMGTGGGLILLLVGAGIWVAKSGLFG